MATSPPHPVPTLENGDQLSRAEFERRYHLMPAVKKAELIEGTVYVPSPVRIHHHGKPHGELMGWIHFYKAYTPGTEGADNTTVRLDLENEPQPDVILRITPECGGATWDSEDGYVEGAPELCVEVAASSVSYDCHTKKRAYRRNGVQEYLIWLVDESRVEWWRLVEGEYVRIEEEAGVLKSRAFPGLWLDLEALLEFDSMRVLEVLQAGLATPEHGQFVATLKP